MHICVSIYLGHKVKAPIRMPTLCLLHEVYETISTTCIWSGALGLSERNSKILRQRERENGITNTKAKSHTRYQLYRKASTKDRCAYLGSWQTGRRVKLGQR